MFHRGRSSMDQEVFPERVLVMDDDRAILAALHRILRGAGFETVEVDSLVGAMDHLVEAGKKNKPFHHVIVDLILKDGDGGDLVGVCESLHWRPHVVVLSGKIDSRRAFELWGRCLYLPKPVGATTLLEALRQ